MSGPETGTKGADLKAVGYVTKEEGRPRTGIRKLAVDPYTEVRLSKHRNPYVTFFLNNSNTHLQPQIMRLLDPFSLLRDIKIPLSL